MGVTIAISLVGTAVLFVAVKSTIGLRPDRENEEDGLDLLDHGEAGYHMDEAGSVAEKHGSATG
jgi:Amt family ammonium transporter